MYIHADAADVTAMTESAADAARADAMSMVTTADADVIKPGMTIR